MDSVYDSDVQERLSTCPGANTTAANKHKPKVACGSIRDLCCTITIV